MLCPFPSVPGSASFCTVFGCAEPLLILAYPMSHIVSKPTMITLNQNVSVSISLISSISPDWSVKNCVLGDSVFSVSLDSTRKVLSCTISTVTVGIQSLRILTDQSEFSFSVDAIPMLILQSATPIGLPGFRKNLVIFSQSATKWYFLCAKCLCCSSALCFSPITFINEDKFSCFVDVVGHSFNVFIGEGPLSPLSNSLSMAAV